MLQKPTAPLAILFFVGFATAQQSATQVSLPDTGALPPSATAYYAGPGVAAPKLIPLGLEEVSAGSCEKFNGTATLTAVVDPQGMAVQILFLRPAGNGIDKMAAHVLSLDRFKPGTRDGAPAATVISDEIKLQTCIERSQNEAGKKVISLHLRSAPEQKITVMPPPGKGASVTFIDGLPENAMVGDFKAASGVSPPVVTHSVEAEFSDYARQNHISGVCFITLIVDEHGLPQDERIARGIESSLDQNALKAISQYRFKPAMKNGIPVPARITIEVDFRFSGSPY